MKASEIIDILHNQIERHGDVEIAFTVKDGFSNDGKLASWKVDVSGNVWHGIHYSNDTKQTTIKISLRNNRDGKRPHISFRK